MAAAQQAVFIAAPTVRPYNRANFFHCISCGAHASRCDRLTGVVKSYRTSVAKTAYCAGGKAPTESKTMIEAMMSGDPDRFNPCAGVSAPHLHVVCGSCGYLYLMQTEQPTRK